MHYKKQFAILLFTFICFVAIKAQGAAQKVDPAAQRQIEEAPHKMEHRTKPVQKKYPLNWQMEDRTDSLYSANINKAYDYIKTHKLKLRKQVIVADIDGGADIDHEDLKNVLWTNPKEIPNNNKDDDHNGYVDDIHGWNFLGNKNGEQMVHASTEADREFMRLIGKYEYAALDSTKVPASDQEEYSYFRHKVLSNSAIGGAYASREMIKIIATYADTFTLAMQKKFPGESDFTVQEFGSQSPHNAGYTDPNKVNSYTYYAMYFAYMAKSKGYKWSNVVAKMNEPTNRTNMDYDRLLKKGIESRAIVGDNENDLSDVNYGNNILTSSTSQHGTHVAGIIGADRNNNIGIKGVADVKLMILRVTTVGGDEYDKDVALAIRYAVDNGARVINMSFGKPISTHKQWVDDALQYAQDKGVFVVHAAGNAHINTNENWMYPVKHLNNHTDLNNFITVGSIGPDGNPSVSSDFGNKEVDLFAPGVNIYSLASGGGYVKKSGTSMAAPLVAGVAAMILNYYPKIAPADLKKLIMYSTYYRGDVEVLEPQEPILAMPRQKVLFKDLCVTGGILDAEKAIEMAKEMAKKSKKRK